jgi:broad specificity phosphatase PhoE
VLKFYFIRHAQSLGNLRPEYVGGQSSHYPLSDEGVVQARLLGKRYKLTGLAKNYELWASPALRTRQTAQYFCEMLGLDLEKVQFTEQLLELSQGDWTGLLRKDVYTPRVLSQIKADAWHFAAPNGESQSDVGRRMYLWIRAQIDRHDADSNKTLYVFTHGVAIKSMLRELFGIDNPHTYKINIENTSITTVDYDFDTCFSLGGINDVAHLQLLSRD